MLSGTPFNINGGAKNPLQWTTCVHVTCKSCISHNDVVIGGDTNRSLKRQTRFGVCTHVMMKTIFARLKRFHRARLEERLEFMLDQLLLKSFHWVIINRVGKLELYFKFYYCHMRHTQKQTALSALLLHKDLHLCTGLDKYDCNASTAALIKNVLKHVFIWVRARSGALLGICVFFPLCLHLVKNQEINID